MGGMIGIPYAWTDPETGERVCPVCAERIAEAHDVDGEQTTNAYGEHYAERHEERAQ